MQTWEDQLFSVQLGVEKPRSRGAPGRRVALCANKLDLGRRAVSRAEGEDFAASHGMRYFETSAATGEQVTEARRSGSGKKPHG